MELNLNRVVLVRAMVVFIGLFTGTILTVGVT